MKTVIQVILGAAICVAAYFVYESVQEPLRFNVEQERRYDATVQRLKDIRTAQTAYRSQYKKYSANFDTLIHFLKTDSFSIERIVGDLDDSASVSAGKIVKQTIKKGVLDSLFRNSTYPIDSIRYVPCVANAAQFELDTAFVTAGNVVVNVFEAKVPFDVLLTGHPDLKPQLLANFKAEKLKLTGYAGLKVGSLTETTNNVGNWE